MKNVYNMESGKHGSHGPGIPPRIGGATESEAPVKRPRNRRIQKKIPLTRAKNGQRHNIWILDHVYKKIKLIAIAERKTAMRVIDEALELWLRALKIEDLAKYRRDT